MHTLEQLTAIKDKVFIEKVSLKAAIVAVIPEFLISDKQQLRNIIKELSDIFPNFKKESRVINLEERLKKISENIDRIKNS
jgi:hypothetical protein